MNADEPTAKAEDSDKVLSRYKRRFNRERAARLEAEAIADRGLRELWLANRELDKRVAERTADLERTLEELETVSKTRQDFLSTLSHEMRTPLNGVLGMLELLEQYIPDGQPMSYLEAARDSAEKLNVLIRRMLDLVELSSGTIRLEPRTVLATDLINQTTSRWQHELLKSGRLLTVTSFLDREATLRLDPERWQQIVDELVANTIDHADPGAVRIRIMMEEAVIVTEVEDSGPGIDQDYERITLTRSADFKSNRSSEGLGLGLVFGREMAAAMGGELTVGRKKPDRRSDTDLASSGRGTVARLSVPTELKPHGSTKGQQIRPSRDSDST